MNKRLHSSLACSFDFNCKRETNSFYEVLDFNASCRDFLLRLKNVFLIEESTDRDEVRECLSYISGSFLDEIMHSRCCVLSGSITKSTFLVGLSDVDVLMCCDYDRCNSDSPKDINQTICRYLEKLHLPSDFEVTAELSTNLLTINSVNIHIVPVLIGVEHLYFPAPENTGWKFIQPQVFSEKLLKKDRLLSGALSVGIKVLKYAFSKLPEHKRLSSHHLEVLSYLACSGLYGRVHLPALISRILDYSKGRLLSPIPDTSQQYRYVDEYLGETNSRERIEAVKAVQRIEYDLSRCVHSRESTGRRS